MSDIDYNHASPEELIEENRLLKEALENARRELAESVRAEIESQYSINNLIKQLNDLKAQAPPEPS